MRHRVKKFKLSRTKDQREALLRGLFNSLVLYDRIETTYPRAKALKAYAERVVTRIKKEELMFNKVREAQRHLYDKNAVWKLVREIAPRYESRNGGYIRVIKSRIRRGDGALMAIVEWVGNE